MDIELSRQRGCVRSARGRSPPCESRHARVDGDLATEERLHLGLLDGLGREVIDERGEAFDAHVGGEVRVRFDK